MFNCCTLSDYNYLLKGLVLYDSLERYTKEEFILYYLCLDQKTYDKLIELNLKNIIPMNLKELEYDSLDLQRIKQQITYQNYCFILSSYFCFYLLDNCDKENILYIDSDIIFYDSLKRVFDTVKDKSIGFIRHRHLEFGTTPQGYFNVGVVYFKGDENGINCLTFWKYLLLKPENRYSKEYGSCGDQKYLELLYLQYKEHIKIIDESIGFGAPFNFDLYGYENFNMKNKEIIWQDKKESMVFAHYIKFQPNFENNTYRGVETQQEWNKLSQIKEIVELYDEYFNYNKEIYEKYLK